MDDVGEIVGINSFPELQKPGMIPVLGGELGTHSQSQIDILGQRRAHQKKQKAVAGIRFALVMTDGAPALALGTEPGDPDIMEQQPRPPEEQIINKYMQIGILVQTIAITAVTLGAFAIGRYIDPEHIEYAETMAFVTLSISELFRAYTSRSEFYPLFKIGVFKNKIMNWAVLGSLVLIMLVIYVPFLQPIFNTAPLGLEQWLEILPLVLVPSIAAEVTKIFLRKMMKRDQKATA